MTTCHSDSQGMKSLRNGKYLTNMKDYIYIPSALNFLLKHIYTCLKQNYNIVLLDLSYSYNIYETQERRE